MAGGRAGVADLRGPRLLNKGAKLSAADLKAALGLVSLLLRLRRSTGTERAQLQWLVLGGVGLLVCFGGSFL